MKACLILALIVWTSAAAAAPAWTWVDENGQRHYSDRPVEGAEQIELPEFSPAPAPRNPAPVQPRATSSASQEARESESAAYRSFEIVTPSQQETFWNVGGTLEVQVALSPELQSGHTIDAYLDGERVGLNATSTRFTLPQVFRGVHSLQAVVLDSEGEELVRTQAATFMVQQTSIQNPNNPNAPGAN